VHWANSLVWIALALWLLIVVGTTHDRPDGPVRTREPEPAPDGSPTPASPPAWASAMPAAPPIPFGALSPPVVAPRPVADWSAPTVSAPPTTSVGEIAPALPPTRRRGLNVPPPEEEPTPEPEVDGPPQVLPVAGLRRTIFFARARWKLRERPEEMHHIEVVDTISQLIGRTPIYNRAVLEVTDGTIDFAGPLVERGARMTTVRREPTPPDAEGRPELSELPAVDQTFDVVIVTHALATVSDPVALLDEVVRVTRPGGTIYLLVSGRHERSSSGPDARSSVDHYTLPAHRVLHMVRERPDLAVFLAAPRLWPSTWGWILRVPVLRDVIGHDIVVVAERRG
jgi:SAM-dependent methyltransferase